MASTYSSDLRLEKQADGENASTWGVKTNNNLEMLEDALTGVATIATTGGTYTLSSANAATDEARMAVLKITGVLVSNSTIQIPAGAKKYLVWNATSGAYTVTVKTSGGAGALVAQGDKAELFCDGTDTVSTVVTKLGAETLKNKTLTAPVVTGLTAPTFTEGAAPGTPAAGTVVMYAKADGVIYTKDDAGAEASVVVTAASTTVAGRVKLATQTEATQFAEAVVPTTNLLETIFKNQQIFTSSGTFTKPTGVTKVFVQVQGSGGGGGGCSSGATVGGGGGGGGGYSEGWVTIAAGVTVTVGAGGTAGANTGGTGGTGGTVSFGASISCTGGAGGVGDSGAGSAVGGVGGTGTGGTVSVQGQQGGRSFVDSTFGVSDGGNAALGYGARNSVLGAGAGVVGQVYGGGGAGALGASANVGGVGGKGCVIVRW